MTALTDCVDELLTIEHCYGRILAAAGYTAEELNGITLADMVLLGGKVMHDKTVDAVAHSTEFTSIDKSFPRLRLTGARDYDFVGAIQTLDEDERAEIRQRVAWFFPPKKS